MANPNNITLRSEKGQHLTFEEADLNFTELENIINEFETFLNTTYPNQQSQITALVNGLSALDTEFENRMTTAEQDIAALEAEQIVQNDRIEQNEVDIFNLQNNVTDHAFFVNNREITEDFTVPIGKNAGTFGPITVANGVTVTVSPGSTWTVV